MMILSDLMNNNNTSQAITYCFFSVLLTQIDQSTIIKILQRGHLVFILLNLNSLSEKFLLDHFDIQIVSGGFLLRDNP